MWRFDERFALATVALGTMAPIPTVVSARTAARRTDALTPNVVGTRRPHGEASDVPMDICSPDARPGINARARMAKPTEGAEFTYAWVVVGLRTRRGLPRTYAFSPSPFSGLRLWSPGIYSRAGVGRRRRSRSTHPFPWRRSGANHVRGSSHPFDGRGAGGDDVRGQHIRSPGDGGHERTVLAWCSAFPGEGRVSVPCEASTSVGRQTLRRSVATRRSPRSRSGGPARSSRRHRCPVHRDVAAGP